jgi:hypothetical protein
MAEMLWLMIIACWLAVLGKIGVFCKKNGVKRRPFENLCLNLQDESKLSVYDKRNTC